MMMMIMIIMSMIMIMVMIMMMLKKLIMMIMIIMIIISWWFCWTFIKITFLEGDHQKSLLNKCRWCLQSCGAYFSHKKRCSGLIAHGPTTAHETQLQYSLNHTCIPLRPLHTDETFTIARIPFLSLWTLRVFTNFSRNLTCLIPIVQSSYIEVPFIWSNTVTLLTCVMPLFPLKHV